MRIRVRASLVVNGEPVAVEGEANLPGTTRLKDLVARADKALGLKTRPIRRAMGSRLPPVVLRNGDRVDLPAGLTAILQDGDEIVFLSPLSGG